MTPKTNQLTALLQQATQADLPPGFRARLLARLLAQETDPIRAAELQRCLNPILVEYPVGVGYTFSLVAEANVPMPSSPAPSQEPPQIPTTPQPSPQSTKTPLREFAVGVGYTFTA